MAIFSLTLKGLDDMSNENTNVLKTPTTKAGHEIIKKCGKTMSQTSTLTFWFFVEVVKMRVFRLKNDSRCATAGRSGFFFKHALWMIEVNKNANMAKNSFSLNKNVELLEYFGSMNLFDPLWALCGFIHVSMQLSEKYLPLTSDKQISYVQQHKKATLHSQNICLFCFDCR